MTTLRILNRKGDTALSWAPDKLAAEDSEAQAAVREAEAIFAEARALGATAFRVGADGVADKMDVFDPSIEAEIVIVPRIAGG